MPDLLWHSTPVKGMQYVKHTIDNACAGACGISVEGPAAFQPQTLATCGARQHVVVAAMHVIAAMHVWLAWPRVEPGEPDSPAFLPGSLPALAALPSLPLCQAA